MRLLLASQRLRQWKGFRNPLSTLLRQAMPKTTRVQAAVAYVSRPDQSLIKACLEENKPLELWSRHDATLATSPDVMALFLKEARPTFACYLIGGNYHPKVIWWHGYGVYIGSANLTHAAWGGNIEAGVFLSEEDLDADDFRDELIAFFEDLKEIGRKVTKSIYEDAKKHQAAMAEFLQKKKEAEDAFKRLPSLSSIENRSLSEIISKRDPRKKLDEFCKEWEGTLQHLRDLQKIVAAPENQPVWMPPEAPAAIQVDQFLHAVYYNRVREGAAIPYQDWFAANRNRIGEAVRENVEWWRSSSATEMEGELEILTDWVSAHRRLLIPPKVGTLSEEEFVETGTRIHAIRDHAKRRRHADIGEIELDDDTDVVEERALRHCKLLFQERNPQGWGPQQLLDYMLFGGPWSEAPSRLFKCVKDSEYKIPRLGLSALGEFLGWGLPEHYPPRNDRTNKALRALGYDVHVSSPNKTET